MTDRAAQRPSPNFDARDLRGPLAYIVLHYTGMGAKAWLEAVGEPAVKLSAHYLIEESGRVVQLVDEDKRAWHAGVSFWRGQTDMNSASIGIELENPGHEGGYRPFPAAQIAALKTLVRRIVDRHALNPHTALLGHSDIAPLRKQDPGELFPWQELAQEGLGLWPQPEAEDYTPYDDGETLNLLREAGYACPATEIGDPVVKAALVAFQRRFFPAGLTGEPDRETVARLRALRRLQQEAEASRPGSTLRSTD